MQIHFFASDGDEKATAKEKDILVSVGDLRRQILFILFGTFVSI